MNPSPETLDELAAAVRSQPGGPVLAELWRAVYGLDRWWLLPTGDAQDPRPMVGIVDEKQFLLAFTSQKHLQTFASARSSADSGIAAMSVTPGEVTGLAPTLAGQGVAGILFDQGVHDLVAPVTGLDALFARFGRPPERAAAPADDDRLPSPGRADTD